MKVFFAMNRERKTAVLLTGFLCWEHVQACFRVGFLMPDGNSADGIGRSISVPDFQKRAAHSGFTVL